jgi:hypothetical protein
MRRGLIVAAALAVIGVGVGSANALAAATTLTVTSPSDVTAADPTPADVTCDTAPASPAMGACTLRAAIDTVNAQATGSGPYTIVVPAGHYLLTERYEISKDVTITGAGANMSIIDGQNAHNPFFISSAGLNVTISGVEITGGNSFPRGGGIYNYGNLELANDWITGNTASDQGGGVYNNGGTLRIVSSTISANNAGNGAGVNSGQLGGSPLGTLSVVNSTISGNVAATDGGGIRALNDTGTTLLNDTIAANTAGTSGGGLNTESPSGPITLKNTILAGNTAGSAPSDCAVAGGPIASTGHNIDQSGTCHLGGTGDMSLNPLLGPLAYNGGPTETLALLLGSPAIDAADPSGCPATDQRGVPRPHGSACDIGAFELAPPATSTGAASGVGALSATLAGQASNPDVLAGSVFFQWGTSPAYGSQTPGQALAVEASGHQFSAALSNLAPGVVYHFRAVAINPDGASFGADGTFTTVVPKVAPTLGTLTMHPSTLLPDLGHGASTARKKKRHRGATISYSDSQTAVTTFTVLSPRKGFRVGHRCQAKRPHGHKGKLRRCTRFVNAGSFTRTDLAGTNHFHFTGRAKNKPLPVGRYQLQAVARNTAGQTSLTATVGFQIIR